VYEALPPRCTQPSSVAPSNNRRGLVEAHEASIAMLGSSIVSITRPFIT
jgi:hypothetical protein